MSALISLEMQTVSSTAKVDWASKSVWVNLFVIHFTILTAITQDCCEQYWTSPGGNTPQATNYTTTCLPSRKLSKLDEPDMQDTAGEAGTSS